MHTGWLPTTLLVDLPNWVGDQMMSLPALHRLVEGNRGGLTVLHTRPNMTRLLATLFPESTVESSRHKRSPVVSARALKTAHRRFDVGVTLRNAARGKILIRLAARRCLGSRGEGALLLMTTSCAVDRTRHQVHDADAILDVVGLEPADPDWIPDFPPELANQGARTIERLGFDGGRTVALAPATARGTSKRWPTDRFAELAKMLHQRSFEPLLVVGPGEESVAVRTREAAGFNLPVVGSTMDVAGLAAVVNGVCALVGNDSGATQLAAALGTPVVAIFGPTDPARTAPRGAMHRVVTASTESGAGIAGISVDQVEAAVFEIVQEGR